jgi:hypothetical protein
MTKRCRNDEKAVPKLLALNCGDLYNQADIALALKAEGL